MLRFPATVDSAIPSKTVPSHCEKRRFCRVSERLCIHTQKWRSQLHGSGPSDRKRRACRPRSGHRTKHQSHLNSVMDAERGAHVPHPALFPDASRRMARVRQKGTGQSWQYEKSLPNGTRYRVDFAVLKKPRRVADIAFPGLKIAVFVDGVSGTAVLSMPPGRNRTPSFGGKKIETNRHVTWIPIRG